LTVRETKPCDISTHLSRCNWL